MAQSELAVTVTRWLAADTAAREIEAEAEFSRVFRVLPWVSPTPGFEGRLVRATRWVRLEAQARALAWRAVTVLATLALAGAAVYATVTWLVPLLARSFVNVVAGIIRGCVWMVVTFADGLDVWAFLAEVANAISASVATPQATALLVGIQLIAGVAFYGLRRILAREQETSR